MRFLASAAITALATVGLASATVGVFDINDLLEPDLQRVLGSGETHHHVPWSHKPYCITSSYLTTLDQETASTHPTQQAHMAFPSSSPRLPRI